MSRDEQIETALRGLLLIADGDHCACGDPGCTSLRDAWAAARTALDACGPGAAPASPSVAPGQPAEREDAHA
jgi:hypothetical protein